MRPQAVIFDCDGLLVDTETAWSRAQRVFYARRSVEFTLDHKREVLGTSAVIAQAIMERHLGLAAGAAAGLEEELLELVREEIVGGVPPMPGAAELVGLLRERGVAIGLASNSPRALLELSLRVSGFDASFAAVVSAQDVAAGKPAPDVYLAACERLGADPARSVALEDSPSGTVAARAAGMLVVGVPSLEGVELPAAHVVASSLHAAEVHEALGLRLAA